MAKRPDFAQKPLDDLRARKERMGLAQATQRLDLDPRPTENYDGSRWPLRGSGGAAGKKMVSIFQKSKQNPEKLQAFSSLRHIIYTLQRSGPEQTQRTVVAGGSWGFGNGVTSVKWEAHREPSASGSLLHQSPISSGGKEERDQASAVPRVSRLQIEEISRGAEKIRRILRAYYREYEPDPGSADIGRDLLRGAIDLKESLSRLQRLPEATDRMLKPQREGAALLKEEEEDQRSKQLKTLKNRALLFPGRAKYPLEGSRGQQRQTAAKPSTGDCVDDSEKAGSHRRSMSCDPSFKPETAVWVSRNEPNKERVHKSFDWKSPMEAASKNSTSIRSGDERKTIPNVIARLMGLEELPPFGTESKNRGGQEATRSGQEARTIKNLRPSKETNGERIHMEALAEEIALRNGVRTKVLPEKETVAIRIMRRSEGLNSEKRLLRMDRGRVDGNASTLAEVGLMLEAVQDPPLVHNLKSSNPHSETGNLEFYRGCQSVVKGKGRFTMQGCQLKHIEEVKTLQLRTARQSVPKFRPHKEQQEKSETEPEKTGKIAPVKANPRSIRETRHERLVPRSNGFAVSMRSTSAIDKMHIKNSFKSSNQENLTISYTRNIGHQVIKKPVEETLESGKLSRAGSKSSKENNKLLVPSGNSFSSRKKKQNAGAVPLPQVGNIRKKLTEADGFQSPKARKPPSEKQTDISQEITQENEGNVRGEEIVSLDIPNLKKQLQKKAHSTACDMLDLSTNHCMMTKRKYGEKLSYDDINKNMRDKVPEKQPSELSVTVDQELHPLHNTVNSVSGTTKTTQCTTTKCDSSNQHHQSMPEFDEAFHTDSEKQLREILTRNHLFQSTAKTLFKINIPVTTIEAGKIERQEEGNKIILDSSNEVMRRKCKREEVAFLYPMKISSSTATVRCLDDLIKDLNRAIEDLEFSSSNEEYLDMSEFHNKLITTDISSTNPDVNCMWDLGWKSDVYVCSEKVELVRDVEKHVLNRLIDHIVEDLLNVRTMHE